MKIISIAVFILSLIAIQINAEQVQKPTPDEVRLYMHGRLSQKEEIRIGRWMMKNGVEFLPLLLEIQETTDNTFIKSGTMHVISRSVSKENSQSVIDRLLEEDTTQAAKTTALELAEKYGYEGERYRTVLLEVLASTEYGGLQERLLKLLRSYGREEDAELVLDVFKNTDNRDIKSLASDTLLAIGGPGIIGPWEEFWREWKEEEPDRQREKREKEEKMAREIGVELPPRRPSKFIDSIDGDIQSLKEKVAAQEAGYTQEDNPKSSSQGGGEEGDEVRASSTGGQTDTGSKSARPWRSFTIVLAGMIALAVLIALARKRKA